MNSKLIDEEDLKQSIERQNKYLNSVLGTVCFTLALTCLGFSNPPRVATFCLFFILPLMREAANYYPHDLIALKRLADETKDPEVMALDKYLRKKYLGYRAFFTKNPVFIVGYGTFFAVLLSSDFVNFIKDIS